MVTVNIDKNKWLEITNWCFEYIDINNWVFYDGPCRINFINENDRVLFALKWGV